MSDLDLTFPNFPLGTHQIPWDLQVLLFKGAANLPRKEAMKLIAEGRLGDVVESRSFLVSAFHETISSMISLGKSRATIESNLEVLWRFFAWSEKNSKEITQEALVETFKEWTEFQIYRSQVKKEISAIYAYRQASKMANLLAKALVVA